MENDKIEEDDLPGNRNEEEAKELNVCAICENGGEILRCEGDCLRSFHPTVEAGSRSGSMCKSLGLSNEQVAAIPVFYCENCLYKQHQCFACGELGSSYKSSGPEVFLCASGSCGRFYHAHCVAKLLNCESKAEEEELQQKVASGEAFTCPSHKCVVCRGIEVHENSELQFAICQRCPKSYHRKCLPRNIKSRRAWEDLLPNHRILIYCLKHEIDSKLKTPRRNHIKFPNIGEKKKRQASKLLTSRGKVAMKERCLASKDATGDRLVLKPPKVVEKLSSVVKQGNSSKKRPGMLSGPESSKKQKVSDTSERPLIRNPPKKVNNVIDSKNRTSLGDGLFSFMKKNSEPVITRKDNAGVSEHEQNKTEENVLNERSALLPLDADTRRRIINIMTDAASSVTLEEIMKLSSQKVPKTHACSSRNTQALHVALQMLEQGRSVEDAKAVCGPGLLKQINTWKDELKVYLAPFLHGPRYTSYGRHFTKEDKLEEIVNLLHWYVQEGDTIIDFCCGANDFSCLMKEKLEAMGKKCYYKNYDVFPAKNAFNFEQRDWMMVETKELPPGSQLIMGLNPPFGVNTSLANTLINHALKFKPKLLVIIAPPETNRLDKGKTPYDLVWRDDEMLSGKSFYLPGSVDVNEKRIEQWNVTTPPLYLWSRSDWTAKHRAIAHEHGHLSGVQEMPQSESMENHLTMRVSDSPMREREHNGEIPMPVHNHSVQQEEPEQVPEKAVYVTESCKEGFAPDSGGTECLENHGLEKYQYKLKGQSPCQFQHLETPSPMGNRKEVHQHFDQNVSTLCLKDGTRYDGTYDEVMARRCRSNDQGPSTNRRSVGFSSVPDHGVGNSAVELPGYHRESINSRGNLSYIDKMSKGSGMGSDVWSSYGQRSNYPKIHAPRFSAPFRHLGQAAESLDCRMGTSTMERYAHRPDELNHGKMSTTLGYEPSTLNTQVVYIPPILGPEFRANPLGFAPAICKPFPQNSSGWIDE